MAEEMAQAAWARGWTRRRQLRNSRWVETWVNSIAMNLVRNSHRNANRGDALAELPVAPTSTLVGIDVEKVLDGCRETDRSLLELHYLYGYTTAEIGTRVGLTSIAVRVRLLRARRLIQKKLKIYSGRVADGNADSDAEALPRAA
jgi:RNA polymerase sigma-70 factor (ECF subfamily)